VTEGPEGAEPAQGQGLDRDDQGEGQTPEERREAPGQPPERGVEFGVGGQNER
jgi:hypothetical protein